MTRLAGGGSAGGVASGSVDGTGSAARFYIPSGVAVSSSGTVYVADRNNNLVRMISPTGTVPLFYLDLSAIIYNSFILGVVTRLAGGGSAGGVASGSVDGTGSVAMFNNPLGVAVSTSGIVYVSDYNNHLIRMISPTGITRLLLWLLLLLALLVVVMVWLPFVICLF